MKGKERIKYFDDLCKNSQVTEIGQISKVRTDSSEKQKAYSWVFVTAKCENLWEGSGCDRCGTIREDAYYLFQFLTHETAVKVLVCSKCAETVNEYEFPPETSETLTEMFKDRAEKSAVEEFEELKEFSDENFIEDLKMKFPEFMKALRKFELGHYTLEDDKQDEVLDSISKQIHSGRRIPSDKQMKAFLNRTQFYEELRRSGYTMLSKKMYGKQAMKMIDDLEKKGGGEDKSGGFLSSVKSQLEKYGTVSFRQYQKIEAMSHEIY